MLHGARRIIVLIVGDEDLLTGIVEFIEWCEFTLVGALLNHTVGHLHKILLSVLYSKKIDFFVVHVVHLELVAHVDKFVIYHIFKVMCDVKTIVGLTDGVEGHILVI